MGPRCPSNFGSTGCEGALERPRREAIRQRGAGSLPPDFGDDGALEQYDDVGLPVVPPPGFGTR